jgi:hypothetical protein
MRKPDNHTARLFDCRERPFRDPLVFQPRWFLEMQSTDRSPQFSDWLQRVKIPSSVATASLRLKWRLPLLGTPGLPSRQSKHGELVKTERELDASDCKPSSPKGLLCLEAECPLACVGGAHRRRLAPLVRRRRCDTPISRASRDALSVSSTRRVRGIRSPDSPPHDEHADPLPLIASERLRTATLKGPAVYRRQPGKSHGAELRQLNRRLLGPRFAVRIAIEQERHDSVADCLGIG